MTDQAPSQDITKTADGDHGFRVEISDNLRINAGIDVLATGNGASGIYALGSNSLSIAGTVSSSLSNGVTLASENLSMDLERTGIVSGGRFGVLMSGTRGILTNYGNISGVEAGVSVGLSGIGVQIFNHGSIVSAGLDGITVSSDATIFNSGLIEGGLTGINAAGTPFHIVSLVNTGRIYSASGVAIDLDNSKKINLVNTGVIDGHVRLSDNQLSDDFYDGRRGTVTGTVFLNAGSDRAYGGAGSETIAGGGGNDTIDGGGGNDIALYGGTRGNYRWSTDNGVTTIVDTRSTGGEGTDTLTNIRFLKFANDETVTLHNASPDSLSVSTGVIAETALVNTPVATFSARDADGDALSYTLSDPSGSFRMDNNNLVLVAALDYETQARQRTITVEAKDIYGGSTTQTVTLSVANVIETTGLTLTGTAGADTLVGENGNDVIYGLSGRDTLKGEDGNDKLLGSLGSDTLTGGLGSDVFVFDARLAKSTASNRSYNLDRITDFSVPSDTLHLSKAVFKTIAKKGVLASSAFHTGDGAHDASDRIVYNKKTGALLYDDDGIGAHAAIQFATLAANLRLTKSDFFVV
jgi:serralysin